MWAKIYLPKQSKWKNSLFSKNGSLIFKNPLKISNIQNVNFYILHKTKFKNLRRFWFLFYCKVWTFWERHKIWNKFPTFDFCYSVASNLEGQKVQIFKSLLNVPQFFYCFVSASLQVEFPLSSSKLLRTILLSHETLI